MPEGFDRFQPLGTILVEGALQMSGALLNDRPMLLVNETQPIMEGYKRLSASCDER